MKRRIKNSIPSAIDSEKGILCSAMLSEKVFGKIIERANLEWFHHPCHKTLWSLMLDQWNASKPVDLISLTQLAEDKGLLEGLGGAVFITEISTFVPVASNWQEYCNIVEEKFRKRKAIEFAYELLESAQGQGSNIKELDSVIQNGLINISNLSQSKAVTKHVKECIARRLDYYETLVVGGRKIEGISSGIPTLDRMIRGLRPGNMIVIGAETKAGKTSLAMNIALNVALSGHAVGIFSLEMNEEELIDRLIAADSEVDLSSASSGVMSGKSVERVLKSALRIAETNIHLRDEGSLTALQFRAACYSMKAQHNVDLIILDYAQLVEPDSDDDSREQQVAKISRTTKLTAVALGIPIIILTQLNEKGRARESRALEHDANVFLVIEKEGKEDNPNYFLRAKLARDCAAGRIPLTFQGEYTKFSEKAVG